MTPRRKRRNSIRASRAASRFVGKTRASQIFKFQARAAVASQAQLASSVSDGALVAFTPFFSCSMTFSCAHRALASNTTSAGDSSEAGTFVM